MGNTRWLNEDARNKTSNDELAKRFAHNKTRTYFIYHVSKQTLDFIRVDLLLAAQANGCRKLGDRDARPPGRRIRIWDHPACNENLPQQIPEAGVMRSLKRKIDPTFDKFILAFLQCLVKSAQVAFLDALCQGQEQPLQPGVSVQESLGGKSLGGEQVAGNEIC